MTEIKDGGPAFPNITPDMNVDGGPGMSLRDWFAGQALAGMLCNGFMPHGSAITTVWDYPAKAYSLADAMIKTREATP